MATSIFKQRRLSLANYERIQCCGQAAPKRAFSILPEDPILQEV
jgi:hypothetical protein